MASTLPVSSIEAKVVAAVGGALAVVFAIHPGWNQSGLASGLESAASAIVGGVIYIVHLFTSRKPVAAATAPVAPVAAPVATTTTSTTAGKAKA